MQCPGKQLFASSGFSVYKCRYICRRDFLQRSANLEHLRAGGNNAFYIGGTLLAREFTVLTLQFVQTEGTVNNKRKDVRIKRLLVKVRGAHSNGLDSIFLIFTTRDHNDLGQWRKPKNRFQQAEAFRGSPGSGGRPRSRVTTLGSSRLSTARADSRSDATLISRSSLKHQRIWLWSPGSSSTIKSRLVTTALNPFQTFPLPRFLTERWHFAMLEGNNRKTAD